MPSTTSCNGILAIIRDDALSKYVSLVVVVVVIVMLFRKSSNLVYTTSAITSMHQNQLDPQFHHRQLECLRVQGRYL